MAGVTAPSLLALGRSWRLLYFQLLWFMASFALLWFWYVSSSQPLPRPSFEEKRPPSNLNGVLLNNHDTLRRGRSRPLPTPSSVAHIYADSYKKEGNQTRSKLNANLETESPGPKSDTEWLSIFRKKLPSLPLAYETSLSEINSVLYPRLWDIRFNNVYWQTLETGNGTLYLYGAYYDNRTLLNGQPVVRILGMMNKIKPNVETYCNLWFTGFKIPISVKTFPYEIIWRETWGNYKNGPYQPYHISCSIPNDYKNLVPESVSLIEGKRGLRTTNLNVFYNKPEEGVRKKLAVCVKALTFLSEDVSVRLVEWIETIRHLGAEKITFDVLAIRPNVRKVLEYYQRKGLVDFSYTSLAGHQPNLPEFYHLYLKDRKSQKRQDEIIPYNDCFFKNMHQYEYIGLLDIDEVIMPMGTNVLWNDLIMNLRHKFSKNSTLETNTFCFRNVYFFDEATTFSHKSTENIPPYMHLFQHVERTRNHSAPKYFTKCFHNTEQTLSVHNHMPVTCLTRTCNIIHVGLRDAQLQHYRANCSSLIKNCDELKKDIVMDDVIYRHMEPVVRRTTEALIELGFLK